MTDELSEPREGFAGIRWSDPRDALLVRFKGTSIATRAIAGHGPGLVIDHHPRGLTPSSDIRVSTTVDYAGTSQIAELSVAIEALTVLDKAQLDALATEVIQALGRRLNLPAIALDQPAQTWTVDGARISVAMEAGPSAFTLTIARPG